DVRDQDRAARIAQEVLELRACLRDGNAHAAVPRVHGDDAELRHPVAPERGEHALRIVVKELFDLWWQGLRRRHESRLLLKNVIGTTAVHGRVALSCPREVESSAGGSRSIRRSISTAS